MPTRKRSEDYHDLAESKGIRWLGPEVSNTRIKTGWECDLGHRWKAMYASVYGAAMGCPICRYDTISEKRRVKPDAYYSLAERRGFRWLGPEVPNARAKTRWECKEGHVWKATHDKIRRGRGCPYCAGTASKIAKDYYVLADERGFLWLGIHVPEKVNIKTGWECSLGHRWEATYNKIQQGKGCPHCAGNYPKTPDEYQSLARKKGFKWHGPFVNTETKTEWECSVGHSWYGTYRSIAQSSSGGNGCPACFREGLKGEGHPGWKGGISFEPYGPDFDSGLKKIIKKRDGYLCQICGAPEGKYAYGHAVHHIDYNKKNNDEFNLITLCISCHCKTNWHRRFYQIVLSNLIKKIYGI